MRKILPLILLAGVGFLTYSCDNSNNDPVVVNPGQDNDTVGVAFDAYPLFKKVKNNLYQSQQTFQKQLVSADMVLIYIQVDGTNDTPVWRLLPYTRYADDGSPVDYSYDFSKVDVLFSVNSTLDLSLPANSGFYTNKRFRVVIIPADMAKSAKSAAPTVDYSDYNSVIKQYKIDESKIKTL
ncbi:hypothetical protein [Chryseobacterium jejuense]|uniref:Uncharacterized protein n=1 Tax=Chryseobacterium jejuense TaxID=445960 RepID=A0A2X2WU81_CHRJE|nr:hypothetical protein [Chryseobacterium jejuense]SDJ86740.1 hypothetical protein SAMN05421542_4541 [Chryseobacterium jejuense]SQB46862.1 Uncharacterised protein [Chryseobacterium jejuense]